MHNLPLAAEPMCGRDGLVLSGTTAFPTTLHSLSDGDTNDSGRERGGNHVEQFDDFWVERQGWCGKRSEQI